MDIAATSGRRLSAAKNAGTGLFSAMTSAWASACPAQQPGVGGVGAHCPGGGGQHHAAGDPEQQRQHQRRPPAAAQFRPQSQPERPHRYYSLRSAAAAGTRAAVQPGPTAITLASSTVAGMAASTSGTGTSA